MGINLCLYRRARSAYFQLSPKERRGMTPQRLLQLVFPSNGEN